MRTGGLGGRSDPMEQVVPGDGESFRRVRKVDTGRIGRSYKKSRQFLKDVLLFRRDHKGSFVTSYLL